MDDLELVMGVDTHKHTHTAAAVSATGGVLGELTVASTAEGYADLLRFAEEHAQGAGRRVWAVEGTASYGAGLASFLRERHETVLEVDRPRRTARRMGAKTDGIDAVRAAREALGQERHAAPRQGDARAALATLLAARRSAVAAATGAHRQLQDLVVTAPEPVRAKLRGVTSRLLLPACAGLRRPAQPRARRALAGSAAVPDARTVAVVATLRALAKRVRILEAEAREHERAILTIVRAWRPDLLELFGVGPITAAVILCAWSHAGRLHGEAAFAMLGGVAPLPASSGQVVRHRLNRYGDRQLNRALHLIVLHRLQRDPETRAYAARRTADGKGAAEIRRCLTRYVAREIFRRLERHDTGLGT